MLFFPLQGAFASCSKLTELQVFTETAEVKVDPDKPLEGARLAVLEVALHFCGEGVGGLRAEFNSNKCLAQHQIEST